MNQCKTKLLFDDLTASACFRLAACSFSGSSSHSFTLLLFLSPPPPPSLRLSSAALSASFCSSSSPMTRLRPLLSPSSSSSLYSFSLTSATLLLASLSFFLSSGLFFSLPAVVLFLCYISLVCRRFFGFVCNQRKKNFDSKLETAGVAAGGSHVLRGRMWAGL